MIIKSSLSSPTLICIRIKSNTCGLELEGLQERPLPHSPLPSPLSSRLAFALVEFQQFGSLARQRRQNTISLHSVLCGSSAAAGGTADAPARARIALALPSSLLLFPISLPKLQFPCPSHRPRPPALPHPILRLMPSSITPHLSKSKVENKIAVLVLRPRPPSSSRPLFLFLLILNYAVEATLLSFNSARRQTSFVFFGCRAGARRAAVEAGGG